MRKRIGWWGLVVGVGLLLTPATMFAQDNSYNFEVPPAPFTGPLSHPRIEDGGIYVGFGFLYWNTNRPLASQSIAKRGFLDNDGSITGTANTFVGSGQEALNTNQLQGPSTYQPGWDVFMGWKFQSGVVVELDWKHLVQAKYYASASVLPPNFNVGDQLQNTFLFAPVSNFNPLWAGNFQNLGVGNPGATFGIWNGATSMDMTYIQRFDMYQINARVPIWQTDNYRGYGIIGPRIVWIWDEFLWRTVDADQFGNSGPDTTAIYHNMVSNRMYGVHAGFGNDWYLGSTPFGAFSATLDIEGGLYVDLVKVNAGYVRADNQVSAGRSRQLNSLVPSFEARFGTTWYPWEGIQIHFGYDVMMFFNTIASTQPVDFNLGTVDPQYDHYFFRWFHGMTFGITFIF